MESCTCQQELQRAFARVRDTVQGVHRDAIIANSDLITHSEKKWMWLYRCRICGTEWADACFASGHVEFYYLFPAPREGDSIRWLYEEAEELSSW